MWCLVLTIYRNRAFYKHAVHIFIQCSLQYQWRGKLWSHNGRYFMNYTFVLHVTPTFLLVLPSASKKCYHLFETFIVFNQKCSLYVVASPSKMLPLFYMLCLYFFLYVPPLQKNAITCLQTFIVFNQKCPFYVGASPSKML